MCETLDAARNGVTQPKHQRRLSCIPSRTSSLKRKSRGTWGRIFLTKKNAGRIWTYCNGIKHAVTHIPQSGVSIPQICNRNLGNHVVGHLRPIVNKIHPFGESDGGRSSGDALPLLFKELRSHLVVGGREIAMIAGSSNRVQGSGSYSNRKKVPHIPVRLRLNVRYRLSQSAANLVCLPPWSAFSSKLWKSWMSHSLKPLGSLMGINQQAPTRSAMFKLDWSSFTSINSETTQETIQVVMQLPWHHQGDHLLCYSHSSISQSVT